MTRRTFLVTVGGVAVAANRVQARAGVHLTGRLDATETELSEHTLNFGKACAIFVNDVAMWDAVQPLIGTTVQLSLVNP